MKSTPFTFASDHGGKPVHCYCWAPADKPVAAIQIAHGMAEHAGRYERLARALTAEGWIVYANDHRGHGKTIADGETPGYFADSNGWDCVVDDMKTLNDHIHAEHSDLPLVLIGHSMGSMLGQTYLIRHSYSVNAAALSATSGEIGPMRRIGLAICMAEKLRRGARQGSPIIDFMGFGAFNRAFEPVRTEYDWLSRDETEVDTYVADPLCGFSCSTQMWIDLLSGVGENERPENHQRVRSDLPLYLLTGMDDPSNHGIDGPAKLAENWHRAGVENIEIKAWPGGRHEMLNETNREQVTADLIRWIADQV